MLHYHIKIGFNLRVFNVTTKASTYCDAKIQRRHIMLSFIYKKQKKRTSSGELISIKLGRCALNILVNKCTLIQMVNLDE